MNNGKLQINMLPQCLTQLNKIQYLILSEHVEQAKICLLILQEHLRSPPTFGGVRVAQALGFYVLFCVLIFVCWSILAIASSVSFRL